MDWFSANCEFKIFCKFPHSPNSTRRQKVQELCPFKSTFGTDSKFVSFLYSRFFSFLQICFIFMLKVPFLMARWEQQLLLSLCLHSWQKSRCLSQVLTKPCVQFGTNHHSQQDWAYWLTQAWVTCSALQDGIPLQPYRLSVGMDRYRCK